MRYCYFSSSLEICGFFSLFSSIERVHLLHVLPGFHSRFREEPGLTPRLGDGEIGGMPFYNTRNWKVQHLVPMSL
jgi:hypothetical protein